MIFLFIILSFLFMNIFVHQRVHKHWIQSTLWKAMTSSCFFLSGLYLMYLHNSFFSFLIVVGLFFGLMGDIWLGLKWSYTKNDELYTYCGFICFLIGHIFYITALIKHFDGPTLLPILLSIGMSFIVVCVISPKLGLKFGKFQGISILYGSLLISMFMIALFYSIANHGQIGTLNCISIGGLCFLGSDLILSGTYFGQGKDRPIDIWLNHFLYYLAQFLLALSILFL